MRQNWFFLLLAALLTTAAFGQTPTQNDPTEADAKLKKDAIGLLRETSSEVGRLRLAENRISFNAELASLMWFEDEREARSMYAAVITDFRQLITQFDVEMIAADDPDGDGGDIFGFWGGTGKSKVERKFMVAMSVRQQIVSSLAEHDPDLAMTFFVESRASVANSKLREQAAASDQYFENTLWTQIAQTNPAKAAEYGIASLKNGLEIRHVELLRKIYAKDVDKGIDFGDAIVSKLKSDKAKNTYLYSSLLSFADSTLEASKKNGKKPVYDSSEVRDIADAFAQYLLAMKDDEDDRYGGEAEYIDAIQKYSPGRAIQLRAKFKANLPVANARNARVERLVALANSSSSGANANVSSYEEYEKQRAAKEKAQRDLLERIDNVGGGAGTSDERKKAIAEMRDSIAKTPGRDKKVVALSLLAAQVAKSGDRELASEIMKDAEKLVEPQPKNFQDYLLNWMLASGYAETDPDKAFPILQNSISRINTTIDATVKMAEFIDINDDYITDGEVQVGFFGGAMIKGLTGELGVAKGPVKKLAKANFAKTTDLADTFDRLEVRILARMIILRAVLDPAESKPVMPGTGEPIDN